MSDLKVLEPRHLDAVLNFEKQRVEERILDPADREMASWHASWRQESLEHYLPLGWSFGVFQDEKILGYFLAQPQLFVGGLTQTLWVEHMAASSEGIFTELVEVAYRVAREKHFQRVLYRKTEGLESYSGIFQLKRFDEDIFELKSAKYGMR